jgi:tRNA modification GTPase
VNLHDSIAAVSTPPGRGGIGIVRISGSRAREIVEKILRFPRTPSWKPWSVTLAELPDAEGFAVDRVAVTYFAAPRSYTT